MSRLWRDRLLVWLAPTEISWLRLSGALKRRVSAKRAGAVDAGYGAQPWQGAVAGLRAEAQAWRSEPLAATIVLSNDFIRYAVVPASQGVSGIEEAHALARFHFFKIHGERSRDWDVRLGDPRAAAPQLACAVDAGLLPALRDCFPKTARPRLVSVQPYLMSAFNCGRRRFPGSGAWLLVLETQRACLALIADGRWVSVQNIKGSFDDSQDWIDLLDRERWRVSLEQVPDAVLVHDARRPATALPPHAAWKLRANDTAWPSGLMPLEDRCYAALLPAI